MKIAVLRLIDLGILWFATAGESRPTEYAYRWTPFGYEVMKQLKIKRMSLSEFEASDEYQDIQRQKINT